MRFGAVAPGDAAGAVLAHSETVGGERWRKGRTLSAPDVARLADAGVAEIMVARIDAEDVREDPAAAALAGALCGGGATAGAAFTGRANLRAATAGLLMIDHDGVGRLNRIDEAITLATLPRHEPVVVSQMLATVKIIPYAVARAALAQALAVAAERGPLIRVAAWRPRRAMLIQTLAPALKASVLDRTAEVTRARLAALGSRLIGERRVAHAVAPLAAALGEALAAGADLLLIAGASAVVDRGDIVPAAIVAAGGEIERFGMPVDPGNLLLLGRVAGVPAIGLPGCARVAKLNGFDWVLRRIVADVAIDDGAIAGLGVGGLLKEIASRPQPRAGAGPDLDPTAEPAGPRIAGVLLAAGQSRRMGRNKLLEPWRGAPLAAAMLAGLRDAGLQPLIVVTGHEADRLAAALAGRGATFVHNPDYAAGLAGSVRVGAAVAAAAGVDGAVIAQADMPLVGADVIAALLTAFAAADRRAICVPTYRGKRGNPILWSAPLLAEMTTLTGDAGAKSLLAEHADLVVETPVDNAGVLIDIDTPDALARMRDAPPSRGEVF